MDDITKLFSTLPAFAQGAAQTGTLGLNRKIQATIAAAFLQKTGHKGTFKELYTKALKAAPEIEAKNSEENPYATFAGQLAGGSILPWKTTSIKGGAGLGALYGGATGLGSNTEGDTGKITGDDLISAIGGAALGAPLGAIGQGISNKFLSKKVPARKEIESSIEQFEKYKVPYKKSDVTANPLDLAIEENALIGEYGAGNQANVKQFGKNQREAFEEATKDLHDKRLGGGEQFTEKGNQAAKVVEDLQQNAVAERAPINEAYKAAKEAVGALDINKVNEFPSIATNILQKDFTLSPANAPKAYSQLKAFKQLFGNAGEGVTGVDFKGLESWRQGLNKAITGVERGGQDEVGVNALKNTFDDWMDNTLEKALISGDSKVLSKFKAARALSSQWMQKYYGNGKDIGKNFVREMVENARQGNEPLTPEIIVNKIFGTSELGFNNQAASIVKELKTHIPYGAINQLRSEAGARLLKPLTKENPNVTTYLNNLNKFTTENHSLAKELFTPGQIKELQDFGEVARKIYGSKITSKLNPSQSGVFTKLNKVLDKQFPWVKDIFRTPVVLNQSKLKSQLLAGEKYNSPVSKAARGLIPLANTESRGDSDTLATKPFHKSTREEREEEQGEYTFGD